MLQAGDEAPDFSLESDEGETVTLSALRGRPVVFDFYPKDDTPGCTAQACSLRDSYGEIAALGAALYGISPDDGDSHRSFREKFGLPFPLLVDTDHAIAELYDVWRERPNGKMGILRSAFVVGPDGRLVRALLRREAGGHDPGGPGGTVGMSAAAPLAGVRVLDLSRVLAGPYCSMVLADLGADVVKLERPGAAIPTRAWGPPFRDGESAYYLCVNRGKRSITVDLADPAGVEVAERLALRGRHRDRELPPGRRGSPRPRLRGALGRTAEDRLQLDRGLLARERRRAPPGLRLRDPGRGGRHVDHGRAGRPAAQGRRRDRGHHDRHVRDHRHARRPARRRADGPRAPRAGQPLRLAAGLAREPWLGLAGRRRGAAAARQRPPGDRAVRGLRDERRLRHRRHRDERAVRALLRAAGLPELAGDERYASNALRVEHRLELAARLADAISGRPTADWLAVLEAANVPGGPVRTIPEAFAHAPYAVDGARAPAARHGAHRALADRASTATTTRRPPRRRCSASTPPRCWPSSATTRRAPRSCAGPAGWPDARDSRRRPGGRPRPSLTWARDPGASGWVNRGWLAPYLPLR